MSLLSILYEKKEKKGREREKEVYSYWWKYFIG
jgi:hypothetical protein